MNLASRLADTANSGEILVSERTMNKAPADIEGDIVDEVTLKGVSRPIKVYSLSRPKAHLPADGTA